MNKRILKNSGLIIFFLILFFGIFGLVQGSWAANPGLQAAYSFDENTGAVVNDVSGNNRNGNLYNGPVWVTGKYGKALSFDGVNDYVDTNFHPAFAAYTFGLWFKTTKDFSSPGTVNNPGPAQIPMGSQKLSDTLEIYELGIGNLSLHGVGGPNYPWAFTYNSAYQGTDWTKDATTAYISTQVNDGQWHYLAGGRNDSGQAFVSLDGGPILTGTVMPMTVSPLSDIFIGARSYNNVFDSVNSLPFTGQIDEVRIYNRALTLAEIQADMVTPINSPSDTQTPTTPTNTSNTLRASSINPRYFTDNSGKAVYLTGSHTWGNLKDVGTTDPPAAFDYSGFLNFLQFNNHNFFRLWTWELAKYTYDGTFKYVSPFPWQRTGPGTAKDGKLKFNLSQFDQAYFDRLRSRVIAAKDKGIYTDIMLFEGHAIQSSLTPWRWDGHPFNINNNVNNINGDPNGNGIGIETHTLAVPAITDLQKAYIRKVVDTVNDLDNVIYEIVNESNSQSKDWQYALINYLRQYELTKPKQHPIGMTSYINSWDVGNTDLLNSPADWISPGGTVWNNDVYQNNPPVADGKKIVIPDTDHLWGMGGDHKWVWKTFARGLNPIYMDDPKLASGTFAGKTWDLNDARKAMGHTLTYANKMNLVSMFPSASSADCSTTYCLRNPGKEYLVYQPSTGVFTVNLSAGTYSYEWFNPATGAIASSGTITQSATGNKSFTPPFSGDAVLYLKVSSPVPDTTPPASPTGLKVN